MHKSLNRIVGTAIVLSFSAFHALAKDAPTYIVTRVMPFAPYSYIYANGVNDKGHFYGNVTNVEGFTWIFWTPEGGAVELKPPSGIIVSIADINNLDELAINSTVGPWVWSPSSGWRPLELDRFAATTQVLSGNDRGQAVGVAFNGDGGLSDASRRAVKWRVDGELIEVRPFIELVPAVINEHVDVAGTAFRSGRFGVDYEPVLAKHGGGYQVLDELPDGPRGFASSAIGLSESGLVAVNSPNFFDNIVACYWSAQKGTQAITEQPSNRATEQPSNRATEQPSNRATEQRDGYE